MSCLRKALFLATIAAFWAANGRIAQAESPLKRGLLLWLDAEDPNGDGQPDAIDAHQAISVWRDKSGSGNHVRSATGGTARRRKNGIGGKPIVRLADGRFVRDRFQGIAPGDQSFQVFVVMRAAPQMGANPVVLDLPTLGSSADGTQGYRLKRKGFWIGYRDFPGSVGKARLGVHVGGEGISRTRTWTGKLVLLEAIYAGNQRWGLYQNGRVSGRGRLSGDLTFVGFEGGARLAIGNRYAARPESQCRADVAEILVYNRPLNFAEQQQVGRYLSKKYGLGGSYSTPSPPKPTFEKDVLPLLAKRCGACHGKDEPEGKLRLTSLAELMRGGSSGPVVQPGNAHRSLLLEMIAANEMPPADAGPPLSDTEVQRIRRWIDGLATAGRKVAPVAQATRSQTDHWAFQPLRPIAVPVIDTRVHGRATRLDAFVLRHLSRRGLKLSPRAGRATLIRRAYLDLLGLLPPPEAVAAFLADDRPDAWPLLLDSLLSSPHFGERWARHWLDGAGYTDTLPLDNDQTIIKPGVGKWKYRDYVIASFNDDKPFADFLREQLAGDELVDWRALPRFNQSTRRSLIATGFLRCSPDFTDENELNTLAVRYGILHRTAETVAGNLLGLTMQCCKCHDHKFEPIPQRDYYRFAAIFAPALNPKAWLQPAARQIHGLGSAEQAELKTTLRTAKEQEAEIRAGASRRLLDQRLSRLPVQIRADVKKSIQRAANMRDDVQKYLVAKFGKLLPDDKQITGALSPLEKRLIEKTRNQVQQVTRRRGAAVIQAVYDTGPPSSVHVLRRGNYATPGAMVSPGLFSALINAKEGPPTDQEPFDGKDGVNDQKTSGRRMRLAKQLTRFETPAGGLLVRVRVNRVWQRLFGAGIVATADNFGVSGSRPTHPQLLEWLAGRFVGKQGRLKPLLKTIMTSRVYMQSARTPARNADPNTTKARRIDPGNKWLWRQRLRRLESEVVRDSMLVAAGRLDATIGGPPVGITNRPDGMVVESSAAHPVPNQRWRRSMYVLQRRNYHLSLLAAFDQPLLTRNCTQRDTSSVVSQSLMMLNDSFVIRQAEMLAQRATRLSQRDEPAARIETAFLLALARPPGKEELGWCLESYHKHMVTLRADKRSKANLDRASLTHICHMLFNTSEFLYVH